MVCFSVATTTKKLYSSKVGGKRYYMLLTSFVKSENVDNRKKFDNAVLYMQATYDKTLAESDLAKNRKAYNRNGVTKDEQKVLDDKKAEIEANIAKFEKIMTNLESSYRAVHDEMVAAGNKKTAVEHVLGVLGTFGDRKRLQLAVSIDEDNLEKFASALDLIHVKGGCTDSGMVSMTKEVKAAIKTAKDDITAVIKEEFSLQAETIYTDKVWVKINATDLRMIHETYVTGLKVSKISQNEEDDFTVKLSMRTAISTKKNKEGEKRVDSKSFRNTIAQIVMTKYSK